jgi:hypothetical protein
MDHLPDNVEAFYAVPGLEKFLLSPRGVQRQADGVTKYSICESCDTALRKHLPKYAIANGFAVGALPHELDELPAMRLSSPLRCTVACSC